MRAALFALCLMPVSVAAQSDAVSVSQGDAFGVWQVNCSDAGAGRTACVLGQQINRTEDQAMIAQMLAFQTPDGSKTFLSARVPNGVYFPAGFAMRAEAGGDVIEFVWQTCGRDLCEAVVEITPERLAELASEGTTVLASYRPNIRAENMVFRFALTGAPEGLAALAAARGN